MFFLHGVMYMVFEPLRWLQKGLWKEHSAREVLEYWDIAIPFEPLVENWIGINRVAEWAMDFHPLVIALLIGIAGSIATTIVVLKVGEVMSIEEPNQVSLERWE